RGIRSSLSIFSLPARARARARKDFKAAPAGANRIGPPTRQSSISPRSRSDHVRKQPRLRTNDRTFTNPTAAIVASPDHAAGGSGIAWAVVPVTENAALNVGAVPPPGGGPTT